jgi:hydrophobe/amphiphile efflux-1 (HAE1) family protein
VNKSRPETPQEEPAFRVDDLASLSIRRPVLVLVLNLLIALAGVAAIMAVEVRELPDVDQPVVSVRGVLPGASPETLDAEVTGIVEGAVARVSGIRNIRSSTEENNFRIHVEFEPGVDLNGAAADVREAVSRVTRELPEEIENLTVIKADNDANPIMNIAVLSEQLSNEELTLVIEKDIVPGMIAVRGVADVQLFGDRRRVLRIVIDPMRLASFGLAVSDVAEVLRNAPFDVPVGSFRSDDQELLVRANATVVTEAQVRDIIIRGNTRVGDVAHVVFGPENAQSLGYLNGRPVQGMGIVRQAQSNTIEIASAVRRVVEQLNERFDNLQLVITEDSSVFIRGSVKEVVISLLLTVLIVITAIWLFLGSFRATLIPSIAIPISLVGTIAAIWLMGFSINILTLLAIVLATGLVVDDAIIVLENIQRRRSQGLGRRAAAVLGTRQMFFAVLATTSVLVAVFIPIAFLPGTAGRLFREFGLVLAVAVAISSFVSLSLVPAMSARLPEGSRSDGETAYDRFHNRLRRLGTNLAQRYDESLILALGRPLTTILTALGLAAAAALLYPILDKELLPQEDRGVIYVDATGPDGVGLVYMTRQAERMEDVLRPLTGSGEISALSTMIGNWDPNRARVIAPLAPWNERARGQQEIMAEIRGPLNEIPGADIRVSSPNSLNLRGRVGDVQFALTGNDYPAIYTAAKNFTLAIEEELPNLSNPDISYRPTQPQLAIEIDRRRAADLGISLDSIAITLRALVDGYDLVDLNVADQAIPIILESASNRIDDPSDLVNLYVSARDGRLLPLSSVVTLREESVAAELDRHAQRRAIEIDAGLAPGYPLAEAVRDLRALAAEILPDDVGLIFLGEAATLDETSRDVAITYAIALIVVFLVLCAQFESLISALIVLLIVPFGLAAAVFALFVTGTTVNIFSQIGLVMLIGLMAKNGILLVEFADQMRDRGKQVYEAVLIAARVRLRPIAMTTLATVVGGLPLILSADPGAAARASIGWIIFGGLGIAALFTLYLTPAIYLLLSRFHKPRAEEGRKLDDEMHAAGVIQETDTV